MRIIFDKEAFGAAMKRAGYNTYEELAEAAGISPTTIYNMAAGKNFTKQTLEKLCSLLGVPATYFILFGESGHTQANAPTVASSMSH